MENGLMWHDIAEYMHMSSMSAVLEISELHTSSSAPDFPWAPNNEEQDPLHQELLMPPAPIQHNSQQRPTEQDPPPQPLAP
eukprot:7542797-Ditylum_brightwellii.AAC.2